MRLRSRLALVATALVLAGCADTPTQPPRPTPLTQRVGPSVQPLTLLPPRYTRPWFGTPLTAAGDGASPLDTRQPDILYHGGRLLLTPRTVAIYVGAAPVYRGGPAPGTVGPGSADNSLIGYFLRNLGGTPHWNINTTYFDFAERHVQNSLQYTSFWAYAINPPGPGGVIDLVRFVDIIESGFNSGAIRYDSNTVYSMFTGTGVNLGGGFSFDDLRYCAFHSAYMRNDGSIVQVAALPYDADFNVARRAANGGYCVVQTGAPNGDYGADSEVSALAHEIEEAATDPATVRFNQFNFWGWWEPVFGENADKCAYTYGAVFNNGLGFYNLVIGSKPFLVQRNWSALRPVPSGPQQGCRKTF